MDMVQEINDFYYHMSLFELQLMKGKDYYEGISYNSLLYLNVIAQIENCTASKIAELLNITKPAVTLKLNELVKQGVIRKKQSQEDKRIYYIALCPHMKKVLSIYDTVFQKIEGKLQKKYTEEQLECFGEILHEISSYEWRKLQNESNFGK